MSLWTDSKMEIKETHPIKSHPKEVKADRIQVLIEMDIEYYCQLRTQIEAPTAIRNRRSEDLKNISVPPES